MNKIEILKKIGFTEYEAKAYMTLCKLGPSSVREIVAESKLPRNKAYEALEKLETKNYAMTLSTKPKKYKITNPELLKKEITNINNTIKEIIKIAEQPKDTNHKELFWIIKGRKKIIEKLAIENEKSKQEILSCSELNKMLYENMRIIKEKTKKGVKVKFITIFNEKNIKYYEAWMNAGVEIRFFNQKKFGTLLPRMTIIDKKQCRITIGIPEVKEEEEYTTLWTESKALCNMLRNQFQNIWKQSTPFKNK